MYDSCMGIIDITSKNKIIKRLIKMNNNLNELLTEFFQILDTVEESDSGKEFHPVFINSCRVLTTKRLNEIFSEIKKIINYNRD